MTDPKFKAELEREMPMPDVIRKVAVSKDIPLGRNEEVDDPPSEGEFQIRLFEGKKIRKLFHNNQWFYSVVDVVEAMTESSNASRYWSELKKQMTESEGFVELFGNIEQLKMEAADGKLRDTDAASVETILRIVQSVPSKKAEPFKRWMAKVGYERIQEFQDPEITVKRVILHWQAQGRTDDWINSRLRSIMVRSELTSEWARRGVKEGMEYGYLTNIISKETFGLKPEEHKRYKGLYSQNLRDHMTDMELVLTMLGEKSTAEIARSIEAYGVNDNARAAHSGGKIAGDTRKQLEKELGKPVVSKQNFLKGRSMTQKKIGS